MLWMRCAASSEPCTKMRPSMSESCRITSRSPGSPKCTSTADP